MGAAAKLLPVCQPEVTRYRRSISRSELAADHAVTAYTASDNHSPRKPVRASGNAEYAGVSRCDDVTVHRGCIGDVPSGDGIEVAAYR